MNCLKLLTPRKFKTVKRLVQLGLKDKLWIYLRATGNQGASIEREVLNRGVKNEEGA